MIKEITILAWLSMSSCAPSAEIRSNKHIAPLFITAYKGVFRYANILLINFGHILTQVTFLARLRGV